jgi:dolichyl-phosphate-mannose--protein O-mannosyl transferase
LFAAGIFASLASSTKWVGLAYLGLIGLFFLLKWLLDRPFHWRKKLKVLGVGVVALLVVPAAIYTSLFAIHFAVLSQSGTGDAFQSPGFQETLAGSAYAGDTSATPLGFWGKFFELNHTMYTANQENLVDPYSSKWYEWPFMNKPVLYWTEAFPSGAEGVLYFVGNPVLWALGFAAIVLGVIVATWFWIRRGFVAFARSKLAFVIVGYFASLVPLAFIGRILFLYHYSPAFIFSLLAFALGLQWMWTRFGKKNRRRAWITLLAVTFAAFLIIAPFTYGTAVSRSYLHFFAPLLHDTW